MTETNDVDNIIKGFEGISNPGVGINDKDELDYTNNEVHVENADGTPLYTLPEETADVDDLEEEIAEVVEEEVQQAEGETAEIVDEAEFILSKLSDKQKRKYYNKDGSLKSASEIIAMHLNLQKALGMPIEKRQEYIASITTDTEEETPEEVIETGEIDDNYDAGYDENKYQETQAQEQAYFQELANLEYAKMQEAWGLPDVYDPNDEQCVKAWTMAQKYAQSTVDFTKQRMKPFEEIQKKPAMVSSIDVVLKKQKIENVSAKELTAYFEGFSLEEWRSMNPQAREMMITDKAKALAYDNMQKNRQVQKQKVSEKQTPPNVTPNAPSPSQVQEKKPAETKMTPAQELRYQKLVKTHRQFLTDDEIKELATQYK